jgi:hypothetical protein
MREEGVHRASTAGEHRPQLLAVHQLGDAAAGVANQVEMSSILIPVLESNDTKLCCSSRRPRLRVQAGGRGHPTERAADVCRVQCGAGTRSSVMGKIITVAADNTNS